MRDDRHAFDYEPVRPATRQSPAGAWGGGEAWPAAPAGGGDFAITTAPGETAGAPEVRDAPVARPLRPLTRGHALSFAGLFVFTAILYFRPYELFPALSSFTSMAFWPALFTLVVFFPTQLGLEGNLTARPREVNLVLLLCLAGLLSIPFAISPGEAWEEFNGTFIKAVLMFVVIVNAARTRRRLMLLLWLSLAISCVLSVGAINDYRAGRFLVVGERLAGVVGGMFGNPNDMALHLVTILPLPVALVFARRNPLSKIAYLTCAALMTAAIVVSFSRGAFLGLIGVAVVLGWKLGRSNRLAVFLLFGVGLAAFVALAPGEYGGRVGTIFDTASDLTGSSGQRRDILLRSILVALRYPIFGVGMGNFHFKSFRELPTHNAYTQVAAEMGLAAMIIYVMFIVRPLRKLRRIERESRAARRDSRFYYYLSIGLQASIVSYMISSFFGSVAYQFYVYYLVGYAVCLRRLYESDVGVIDDPAEGRARPAAAETAAAEMHA